MLQKESHFSSFQSIKNIILFQCTISILDFLGESNAAKGIPLFFISEYKNILLFQCTISILDFLGESNATKGIPLFFISESKKAVFLNFKLNFLFLFVITEGQKGKELTQTAALNWCLDEYNKIIGTKEKLR